MYEIENFNCIRYTSELPREFTGGYRFYRWHIELLTPTGRDYIMLPTAAQAMNVLSRARPDLFNGAVYDDPAPFRLLPYVLRAAAHGLPYNPRLIGYIAENACHQLIDDVKRAIENGRHQ